MSSCPLACPRPPQGSPSLRSSRSFWRAGRLEEVPARAPESAREARALTVPERQLLEQLLTSAHLNSVHDELRVLLAGGNVGAFEQEEHQPPPLAVWPFYPDDATLR